MGTVDELEKQTKTDSVEAAFLSLTGNEIREEEATGTDRMRQHRQAWRGGKR